MRKIFVILIFFFFQIHRIFLFSQAGFTLIDFVGNDNLQEKSFGSFVPSQVGNYFFKIEGGSLKSFSFENGKLHQNIIDFSDESIESIGIPEGFQISGNEKKVLFHTSKEPLYRYSFYAKYYVFDFSDSSIQLIDDSSKIRDAKLSPNGKYVSFIKDNNLFVQDLESQEIKKITHDGRKDSLINAAPDWVYEEEFLLKSAYQWSEDGAHITFLKFNESQVSNYLLPIYNENNYPQQQSYKYPKAGENNSIVSLWVYSLSNGALKEISIAHNNEFYIPRFCWTNQKDKICFTTLNRTQSELKIYVADINSGISEDVYKEKSAKYIELTEANPVFINNENDFLFTSEKGGTRQIYKYSNATKKITQLSNAGEVVEIIQFDKSNQRIFYTVNNNPLDVTVSSISLSSNSVKSIGQASGKNVIFFSSNFSHYVLSHHDAHNASSEVLCSIDGSIIDTLFHNELLENDIKKAGVPLKEFFKFTTSEGIELNGYFLKPSNFDPLKKYPVLLYVYGGPGSQTVTNSWKINWLNYIAQEGYLVVSVDNRGTGGRGASFRNITYGNLGFFETRDQIEVAKYLQKLAYVDPQRIGVYGWSFGGYMSLMCLMQGADFFKTAISVAPPVHWKFYDTVYGERYMGLPSENQTGYEVSSVLSYTPLMQGKLLLVHGTADDNVHIQNSMVLVDALVRDDKDFEMLYYTNKNHSISGGNTRFHLFKKMTEFLKENL